MATKKRQTHRHMKKVSKDCWAMDWAYLKWMDEHLRVYLKDASRIVNLEFYKFDIDGETFTQRQAIEEMIRLTTVLLDENVDYGLYWNDPKAWNESLNRLNNIWAAVCPCMWW